MSTYGALYTLPRSRVQRRKVALARMLLVSSLCSVMIATHAAHADSGSSFAFDEETPEDALDGSGWTFLIIADTVLLFFAALFAGLTLALNGLDTLSLEIIADSGSEPDKTYASKILPIRQLGNQLLCTLIFGNVVVNTLIAQITDSHLHGWLATIISTALTTLGGEVIPQALMSAHALAVGSKSAPIVKFFVILFYPIAKPLSMMLDYFIGKDPGQIYERDELKKLMVMHAAHGAESGIATGEVDLMVGAMELHEKTVMEVMTPISEVLMLEASELLNEETLQLITDRGHSRIPVYQTSKNNIIGLLFAKDLLMANLHENTKVLLLVKFYNRSCHVVSSETKLISMLKYFQTGNSHIALVQEVQQRPQRDPYYEIKGLVTMEDVIEELIHSEIFDEYDVDPNQPNTDAHVLTGPGALMRRHVGLSAKNARRVHLNHNQVKAAALFLSEVIEELSMKDSKTVAQALGSLVPAYRVRAPKDARGLPMEDRQNVWLYRDGVPSQYFTLVISGCVEIFAGREAISLELGSWSVVAPEALHTDLFIPSFSCRVVQDAVLLQITSETFSEILNSCSALSESTPSTASHKEL